MHANKLYILLILLLLLVVFSLSPEIAAANPQSPSGGATPYYLAEPAYDSGWFSTGVRVDPVVFTFDHNLGGSSDLYFVQLDCRNSGELGQFDCTSNTFHKLAHWYGLTDSQVKVWVVGGSVPSLIRVRIWRLNADYTSGWVTIGVRPDPIAMDFMHSRFTPIEDMLIALDCQDDTELGHYDCTDQAFNTQAHWFDATTSTISVYIVGGSQPDQVRVRIFKIKPKFDSGWISAGIRVDPISVPVSHSLSCPGYNMVHKIICYSDKALGTYDCTNQAFNIDAHWYNFVDTSVNAFINNGPTPSDFRILVYYEDLIFLPAVFDR